MNKFTGILVFLLHLLIAGNIFAQRGVWTAGIEGGPGVSFLYGSGSVYNNFTPSLAGVAGIFGEYGFAGRFSAKAALHYERISSRIENKSSQLDTGGMQQFNLDYVSLPLLVKWTFGRRIQFFINAGPNISYLLKQSTWYNPESGGKVLVANETQYYQSVHVAATAGIGAFLPFAKRFLLSMEIRDNFGLLNIRSGVSDFERKSYSPEPAAVGYTNSTLLMIGIAYRFGRTQGLPCTPGDPDFQYIKTE
jgi:hypothetical protein